VSEGTEVVESRGLAIGYHGRRIGADISFTIARGELLGLLGPNGCGKTTLFNTVLGLLPPLSGEIRLLGEAASGWARAAFARHVGYVPQSHAGIFPYTVQEIVLMGRCSRVALFATPSQEDREVARVCLDSLGIGHLGSRIYSAISGGERQLALIARALAQEPDLLVMDEPTASLDFGNQIRVLERVANLRSQGIAVLMSTHQPEHALRVADRIALLSAGRIVGIGPPHPIATASNLASLYGVAESAVAECLGPHLRRSECSPTQVGEFC